MRWSRTTDTSMQSWPPSPRPGGTSTGRQTFWLAVLLIVVSGFAVAVTLVHLHQEALRSGERLTRSLTRVIEEQTNRSFQSADQRLALAENKLQALVAAHALNEQSARAVLREQLRDLPFVRSIWTLDAAGRIEFESGLGNIGNSLGDREYFRIYRDQPATQFHISAPVLSRTNGKWLLSASRPRHDALGNFTGVIVAAVEPPYFDALWRDIDLGPNGAIAMLRKDGLLMMRSPHEENAMGKSFAQVPIFSEQLPQHAHGLLHLRSPIDHQLRIVGYRTLAAYPDFLVTVAPLYDDILAPWHRFASLIFVIWLAASAAVVVLSTLLHRQSRKRQRTELQFHQLAQAMPQVVFITDAHGKVQFINDQWTAVTGRPVSAVQERGWVDLIHPDDRHKPLIGAVGANEVMANEHRVRCADGAYRWRLVRASPNRDAEGRVVSWYGTSTDIDDLKQTEAALKSKTDLLQIAGHMARLGAWAIVLPDQRMVWSDEALAVLGLQPGQCLTAPSAIALFEPASRERATQAVAACIRDGSAYDIELEMLRPGGPSLWIRSIGQAVRGDAGTITGLRGALQDVSERVRTERDIQAYLRTLHRVADAAQATTQHQTLDAMLLEVAQQARSIIGAHQAAVSLLGAGGLACDWQNTITQRSLSEKYAACQHLTETSDDGGVYAVVCETNQPLRLTQAQLLAHPRRRGFGDHASEHPPMNGWLAVPLMGRDGGNIGVLQLSDKIDGEFTQQDEYVATELAQLAAIASDNLQLLAEITTLNAGLEEKIAQRTGELHRQEALFRALAEQAPHPIWTIDTAGAATFFSRAWYQLFGGKAPDWHGKSWFALVHPDDRASVADNWQVSSQSKVSYTGTRRLRARDGSFRTMSYRTSPVFNDAGTILFWVGIDVDITEIKAIETALRLSNAELEAFSYSVSHDLRSPLNTVHGFSSLLAKELKNNDNEKIRHYQTRIQYGVTQMSQLIEGMLALAHVARQEMHSESVDLSAIAQQIVDRLRQQDPARSVSCTIEARLVVTADSRLMHSVMDNLVGNAWKFTSREAHAEISVGWSADQGAFFVRDNGAGFDMAYADRLFGTFQRLHSASEFTGTGVGLATVARVITRHGGRIWAESTLLQGATFFFTLPDAGR